MPERKFEDGETVVYDGVRFTIEDAYYKRPRLFARPGWYYDLDHEDRKQIAEADLRPAYQTKFDQQKGGLK